MEIIKTYFGFRIKDYWDRDINIYKLLSRDEYDIVFSGEIIGKIKVNSLKSSENKIKIIYSRNMNIAESDIAEIAIKIIELASAIE